MTSRFLQILFLLLFLTSCSDSPKMLGRFDVNNDLFLAQFDSKTDVDDIHSIAGVATMLKDSRFTGVKYHAVAGAYGIQEGLFVPANELFQLCFGKNWSDAHSDYNKALGQVLKLTTETLEDGGKVWIAEAGQSNFSSDLIRGIKKTLPEIDTKVMIHIVQHSDWNEKSTDPEDLAYVKEKSSYQKIPDGNVTGNGSPGFLDSLMNWREYVTEPELYKIWETATDIADKYNGKEDRYLNKAIAKGGLDFSDVSETCWIFGFDTLKNAKEFFGEFAATSGKQAVK